VLNKECFQAEIINKVEYIMLGNELTDNATQNVLIRLIKQNHGLQELASSMRRKFLDIELCYDSFTYNIIVFDFLITV
jgi:hypothetical protein